MGLLRSSINLGCVVTDEVVTVVACSHHTRHVRAHKYAQTRLRRISSSDRVDVDLVQIEKALASMVNALKIKRCECIISIPLAQTTYGFFTAPLGESLKTSKKLLVKHIQNIFTVPVREILFKTWTLPSAPENKQYTFGYYAFERSVLDSWRALGKNVGLRITHAAVDMPSILSMVDACEDTVGLKGFIDVGELSTICVIGSKKAMEYMSSLPWGLHDAYTHDGFNGLRVALQTAIDAWKAKTSTQFLPPITWYIFAADELITPLQDFLTRLKYTVSPLNMLFEIPNNFRTTAFIRALSSASRSIDHCFKI